MGEDREGSPFPARGGDWRRGPEILRTSHLGQRKKTSHAFGKAATRGDQRAQQSPLPHRPAWRETSPGGPRGNGSEGLCRASSRHQGGELCPPQGTEADGGRHRMTHDQPAATGAQPQIPLTVNLWVPLSAGTLLSLLCG